MTVIYAYTYPYTKEPTSFEVEAVRPLPPEFERDTGQLDVWHVDGTSHWDYVPQLDKYAPGWRAVYDPTPRRTKEQRLQDIVALCQDTWKAVGDCALDDWKAETRFSVGVVVTAWGHPPRKRKPYKHAFIIRELGGIHRVVSIIRAIGGRIEWMINGQATKGQTYRFFGESSPHRADLRV